MQSTSLEKNEEDFSRQGNLDFALGEYDHCRYRFGLCGYDHLAIFQILNVYTKLNGEGKQLQ